MGASTKGAETPLVLDIRKYILQQYVAAKVPERMLELVFDKESLQELQVISDADKRHGQQKCRGLTFPFARSKLVAVPIKAANVLVAEDKTNKIKRVLELSLDAETNDLPDYQPGDTIGILPSNPLEIVAKLLNCLDLLEQADVNCHLEIASTCKRKTAKLPVHIPTQTTPREILSDCVNLHGVLKKQFFAALAANTTDELELTFLEGLSSKEGTNYYNELILERNLTILDILEACVSCKPTLALLVEHLPRLLPRPYSIANSTVAKPNQLNIIFSILSDRPGITTSMLDRYAMQVLNDSQPADMPKVFIYARETNKFRYTKDSMQDNQILIAIGTAVAPFIGFMEHKLALDGNGQTWLYAGAKTLNALPRHKFLEEMKDKHLLNRYLTCESSNHSLDNNPHYVQDLIANDLVHFVSFLLKPETKLYICADGAKISKSIEKSINVCLQEALNIDELEASQRIKQMRETGKYLEDLWL